METSVPYLLVLTYLVYIVGLTLPPILVLIRDYFKSFSSKKYKYVKSKKCSLYCWVKTRLSLTGSPKERLSVACFITGVGSVFLSAGIMMSTGLYPNANNIYYNQLLSVFVGLWAPNLILLSLYFKK